MQNFLKAGKRALTVSLVATTAFWAMGLAAFVPAASAQTSLNGGDLIKASGAAVYYYGADGKRYVFPNEKTFKTWYSDFSSVKTITDSELAAIEIGGNVTYRPGTRLVKITTDPKTYAVEPGGSLRWITSEQIAMDLYGANWNQWIDDVSDAFFVNYTKGSDLTSSMPTEGSLVKSASASDIYYVAEGGMKRKVADFNVFSANNFNSAYILTVSDTILNGLSAGSDVTSFESSIAMFDGMSGGGQTVPSGSGLMVGLSSDTPSSTSVIADSTNGGQALVNFAAFDMTASSDGAVKVKTLKLKRVGIASDSDLLNMYLYMDGMRKAEMQSISSGVITFTATNGLFEIPAGMTKKIWVKGDISSAATSGKTLGVQILGSADVDAMGASVTGAFPLTGNQHTVATVTDLGKLTVANVTPTSTSTADPQLNYELWKFSLLASNQDLEVSRLAFTNVGSTSASDIVNFKLYDGATLLGTVAAVDSEKRLVFDFSSPLMIKSGVTKQLSLRADIIAGSTRTFQMSLQKSSDVMVRDLEYGVEIFPFPSGGTVGVWTVVQAGGATTINSGSLTVGKAVESPTTEIVNGGTNVPLATWDFEANGESVKVSTLSFTPTIGSSETINNARLFFDDTQVGTTQSTITGGTDFSFTLGNSLIVPADGAKHKVMLKGDTTGNADAGDTVSITLKAGTGNAQGMASLSSVNAPASAVASNSPILTAGTLTASRVGPTTYTYVENTTNTSLGMWSLEVGSAEDVDVNSITFKDCNSTCGANGATGLGSAFSNLKLYHNGTMISTVIANPSTTAGNENTFNISPAIRVSGSSPQTFELKGDVISGADAAWTDTNAVGITSMSGTGTLTTTTVSSTTDVAGPSLTVGATGTLSVALDTSGAVSSRFYTVGLTDQEFARFRLSASNEDVKLTKFVVNGINATNNILNLKLTGTGLGTDPVATVSGNTATFNFSAGSEIVVPKDSSKVITVKGATGALAALVAGQKGAAYFGTADAVGSSSGTVIQENFGGTAGTNYYVAGTNAYSGDDGDVLYFTRTADAGTNTAPGYYMVTTDEDAVNLATGDLALNGGGTQTSWTSGDVIVKLTKSFAVTDVTSTGGVTINVGDLLYIFDASATSGAFYIATDQIIASNTDWTAAGEVVDGFTLAAGDQVTKITNTNALAGNVMQFEEVEPVMTLNPASTSGTVSPNANQVVGVFDIKAEGQRDMTISSLNFLTSGSNFQYVNVQSFKLYDGVGISGSPISEATVLAQATTADAGGTYTVTAASTSLVLCNTAAGAGANQELNVGTNAAAASNKIPVGGKITVYKDSSNFVTYTVVSKATGSACTGAGDAGDVTLTLANGTATGSVSDDDAPTIYGHNVVFDSNSSTALPSQIITQGTTKTVTVVADTTNVKSGVTSGTVTYNVSMNGTTGPNVDASSSIATVDADGALTWTYTPFGSGTAHTGTSADGYPVNANTLSY